MTYSLRILAIGVTSLLFPACFGTPCKLGCGDSGKFVALPVTGQDTLTFTTELPCRAQGARRDNDELAAYVYTQGATGTCNVRVEVLDGGTYTFSVQFDTIDTMTCCGTVTRAVDASVPELVSPADGGARS